MTDNERELKRQSDMIRKDLWVNVFTIMLQQEGQGKDNAIKGADDALAAYDKIFKA